LIVISYSPEETLRFGELFARKLKPGDVVALTGELGAGKTQLAKGICRGLGYQGDVTSPSYVHIHVYSGDFSIYHVDLYLDRSSEDVLDLGLDELFTGNGIVLIEWADRYPDLLPDERWWIEITWQSEGEMVRKIEVRK